jgi:hypothetical protein
VGAGVEPRVPPAEELHPERPVLQVQAVQVRDLELPSGRRREPLREVDHPVVVEVQAGDRPARLRARGLLLEAQGPTVRAELDDAVLLRPLDRGATVFAYRVEPGGALERLGEPVPVEEVVPEDEAARLAAYELLAHQERLREAARVRLHRVPQGQPPPRAVAEQIPERLLIARRRDDQHVPYPGQHQGGERVVDHRLVVDRQELLARRQRDRVEARARPSGEDDRLLNHEPFLSP